MSVQDHVAQVLDLCSLVTCTEDLLCVRHAMGAVHMFVI